VSPSATSTRFLNPSRDGDSRTGPMPGPTPDRSSSKGIFPNTQPEPPLTQPEAVKQPAGDGSLRFPGRERARGRRFLQKTNSTSTRPNVGLATSGESRAALGAESRDRRGGKSRRGGSQGPSSAALPGLLLRARQRWGQGLAGVPRRGLTQTRAPRGRAGSWGTEGRAEAGRSQASCPGEQIGVFGGCPSPGQA